ncbi:hypothetical protein ABZ726_38235, partial [Streptomyces hundungensis]
MNEEISRRLREAAESHQPDRAKMLARVERGALGAPVRHRTPSIVRSRPKAALAGLVTAGILATGGVAVAGIVGGPSPSDSAPAAPPSSVPSASPAPSATARPRKAGPLARRDAQHDGRHVPLVPHERAVVRL